MGDARRNGNVGDAGTVTALRTRDAMRTDFDPGLNLHAHDVNLRRKAPIGASAMFNGARSAMSDDEPKYVIGYRKPPVETRFKPGASGNPKGRPKAVCNLPLVTQQVFTNGVVKELLTTLREGARRGNLRVLEAAIKFLMQMGMFRERKAEPALDLTGLTDSELRTLEQIMLKVRRVNVDDGA